MGSCELPLSSRPSLMRDGRSNSTWSRSMRTARSLGWTRSVVGDTRASGFRRWTCANAWTGEQVGLVVGFSAAVLGWVARSQVTPNSRVGD